MREWRSAKPIDIEWALKHWPKLDPTDPMQVAELAVLFFENGHYGDEWGTYAQGVIYDEKGYRAFLNVSADLKGSGHTERHLCYLLAVEAITKYAEELREREALSRLVARELAIMDAEERLNV